MTQLPEITTERLLLRGLIPDDAESLHAVLSDVELMTYWSSAPHETLQQTIEYLEPSSGKEVWRPWAITLGVGQPAIGWVAVGERRPAVSEIGYILARQHWGRGIAREAVSAVIDHLFTAENHRRIFADTDPENTSSNQLLEKLGFTREGYLRAEWETHLGIRDSYIWGLLADEWRG